MLEEPSETNAVTCTHCEERFPSRRLRDLHRGLKHYDDLAPEEVEAYEDAYLAEEDDLHVFRIKAVGALVALYFVFLFAYSVFA